jgi:hypothetical protein
MRSHPSARPVEDWNGRYRSYDLLKEIVVVFVVVGLLALALAVLFGAPQRGAVTFREWSTQDPAGFLTTTLAELNGTSDTAQYGPPYTEDPDAAQSLFGFFSPQRIAGVTIPIDPARDLVLDPLGRFVTGGSALGAAFDEYRAATPEQRLQWVDSYSKALVADPAAAATLAPDGAGPLPTMLQTMLSLARSGAVDAALLDDTPDHPGFFVMDYTRSQLFLADGDYFANLGNPAGLAGDEWGMAATVGNWPGQIWLIPVSLWYQIPPGSTSDNGDIIVLAIVAVLGIGLVLVPYIPGIRALPERLGVYRLIWRRHYHTSNRT